MGVARNRRQLAVLVLTLILRPLTLLLGGCRNPTVRGDLENDAAERIGHVDPARNAGCPLAVGASSSVAPPESDRAGIAIVSMSSARVAKWIQEPPLRLPSSSGARARPIRVRPRFRPGGRAF